MSAATNAAERRARAKALGYKPFDYCPVCGFTFSSQHHLDNCECACEICKTFGPMQYGGLCPVCGHEACGAAFDRNVKVRR